MSYDISLLIDTGNGLVDVEEVGNYTYNVSPMYKKAMGSTLSDFNGVEAWKVIAKIAAGVDYMKRNREEMEKLAPSNGWGNYEGALEYLEKFLTKCERHPKTTISVH